MTKLSLLSVVTPQDLQVFKLNVATTIRLNKGKSLTWVVVCNGDELDFVEFKGDLGRVAFNQVGVIDIRITLLLNSAIPRNNPRKQSFEHGYAINFGLKNSNLSDGIVIILDPDFNFIKPNWLDALLSEYNSNSPKVLGTSWDPARLKDWGDFPAPHLMIMSTDKAMTVDFTPKGRHTFVLNSSKTFRDFRRWVNQRVETGSKLQDRHQILKSLASKCFLMILFNFHRNFPRSRLVRWNYLLARARQIQIRGGLIFEHSHSYRAKKALKILMNNKFWFTSSELVFRYLVFMRNKELYSNVSPTFFKTPLEFLNYNNEKIAVHARSVGSNFSSHANLEDFFDTLH